MTEVQCQQQINAARWLIHFGFTTTPNGDVWYTRATGQRVRVRPANEAQWRDELTRRFAVAFPSFRWALPTAETMARRWGKQ